MTTPEADSSTSPVALITGAGSGIGREIALKLASLDYRVALAGRRPEPLRETGEMTAAATGRGEGEGWLAVPTDVSQPDQVAEMVESTVAAFGRLDALVNNAGWTGMKPIEAHSADEVRTLFEINAMGPIWAIAAALPTMLNQKSGAIVNVSSMATTDPFPGLGVYGAAKAACETICVAIRNEHGRENIRAYCIAPGAVETELLRSIVSETQMPTSATLDPETIASRVIECVTGETNLENGQTLRVMPGA